MTTADIYTVCVAATIMLFGSCALIAIREGIRRAFRWCDAEVERNVQAALGEQAADHDEPTRADVEATYGPLALYGPIDEPHLPLTDAEVDAYWDRYINPLGITNAEMRAKFDARDVVDGHALPLSQTPRAQRIRALITDGECRRFRDELNGWGDAS